MLRPRDCAGLHSPQRGVTAGQFGKAAQVAGVVGWAEKIRHAGELRGVLGGLNPRQRQ